MQSLALGGRGGGGRKTGSLAVVPVEETLGPRVRFHVFFGIFVFVLWSNTGLLWVYITAITVDVFREGPRSIPRAPVDFEHIDFVGSTFRFSHP